MYVYRKNGKWLWILFRFGSLFCTRGVSLVLTCRMKKRTPMSDPGWFCKSHRGGVRLGRKGGMRSIERRGDGRRVSNDRPHVSSASKVSSGFRNTSTQAAACSQSTTRLFSSLISTCLKSNCCCIADPICAHSFLFSPRNEWGNRETFLTPSEEMLKHRSSTERA